MDPEYAMMLETFMETAKAQNQKLVDGAVFIFVPPVAEGENGASVLSWMPEYCEREVGMVWHDVFVSLLWALINAGVDTKTLKEMVDYAATNSDSIKSSDLMESFKVKGGEVN